MLLQTAVILLCGFTVSNATIAEDIQAVKPKVDAIVAEDIQADKPKVDAIVAEDIQADKPKVDAIVAEDIQADKPKVDAIVAEQEKKKPRKRQGNNCLKLTKEDVARYEAQIKADKPKIVHILRLEAPDEFDWRDRPGYITPVVDQADCYSCWAFAFAGQLESRYAIQHGTNAEPLSKSELVECTAMYETNNACTEGGNFEQAFNYTAKYGLLSEREYPYRNQDATTQSCGRYDFGYDQTLVKPVRFAQEGRYYVASGNHEDIKTLLFQYGPIFTHVNDNLLAVNTDDFDIIRKDDVNCCPRFDCPNPKNTINHCVILVGYGVENDVPYWIIKNSWGTDQVGEGGYHRLERGSNACGVESVAFQVTITN